MRYGTLRPARGHGQHRGCRADGLVEAFNVDQGPAAWGERIYGEVREVGEPKARAVPGSGGAGARRRHRDHG